MEAIDFKGILENSGVRNTELAQLVSVTRAAVSSWVRGKGLHKERYPKVAKCMEAIKRATESGSLPVNTTTSRTERMTLIKQAILAELKKG